MYLENTLCPLCERFSDTQNYILHCKVLQDIRPLEEQVEYTHSYGTINQQEELVKVIEIYLGLRDELLDDPSPAEPTRATYGAPATAGQGQEDQDFL